MVRQVSWMKKREQQQQYGSMVGDGTKNGKSTRLLAIFLWLIFCLLLRKNTYVLDGLLK